MRRAWTYGAGDGIESLLEDGDAGKQPVAIAVQCVDGGGKAPCFVFACFRNRLKLPRLPCQIGCGVLLVSEPGPEVVRQKCDDDGSDGAGAPRSEPPQGTAVERAFVGQKAARPAAAFIGRRAPGQIVLILRHNNDAGPPQFRIMTEC